MSKLYKVTEEDLECLENLVPALALSLMPHLSNRDRVALRQIKRILSDVRWEYGPHKVEAVIPAQEPEEFPDNDQNPNPDI